MEIRLKYSYSGLLLFTIVTVGLIVAGFLLTPAFWISAGLLGVLVVLFILDAVKNRDDALVIDDKGIWVDGEFEIDWAQVNHCYVSVRTGVKYSDDYYLVFITKQGKRHAICLNRYI